MLTSSYPKFEGDACGVFVYTLFQELRQKYPIKILIPDAPGGVQQGQAVVVFKYFIPSLQKLTYGSGIVNNIKREPWLILELPFFLLAQIHAIRTLLKKDPNIKILHAHWWIPQGLSAVLCRMIFSRHLKIVCTVHGPDLFGLKGFFWDRMRSLVLGHTALTITTSEVARQALKLKRKNGKTITIPAGIRPENFPFRSHAIARSCPKLLFVGRLIAIKGVWEILSAMMSLRSSLPNLHLTMIGEGVEHQAIADYIQKMGLHPNVDLLGSVKNERLSSYYHASDVLVLPSHIEGLPVVLMEAMASGTLVLSTTVGGIPELVQDGVTGFLCKPGDSQDLSETIIRIYRDHSEQSLKVIREQACKQVIEGDYNLNNQREKIISIYDALYQSE